MSSPLWVDSLPAGGIPTNNEHWEKLVQKAKIKLPLFHYESESIAESFEVSVDTVGSRSKIEFTLDNEHYMLARDYIFLDEAGKEDKIHCFQMNPDYTWKLLPDEFLKKIENILGQQL